MKILGISAFFHDSAAALIVGGEIIAAAQEERFTRKKNDASFPTHSISYFLKEAGISANELDAIVFYEKPFLKFERILSEFVSNASFGLVSFAKNMPSWIKQKLFMRREITQLFDEHFGAMNWNKTSLLFSKHHLSHAASSFFTSPFPESAIITFDGVGEFSTATIAYGKGNQITTIKEQHFPDSIGLFYSAVTTYLGFEVNNGEYKMMGLAPYAENDLDFVNQLITIIETELIKIHDDGSIQLNPDYFQFGNAASMIHKENVSQLLKIPSVSTIGIFSKEQICLGMAVQKITKKVVLKMVKFARENVPSENLCLADGLALKCVLNGKIKESGVFKSVYIQPAAGDAGGALSAALSANYIHFQTPRKEVLPDKMKFSKLGTEFSSKEIETALKKHELKYVKVGQKERNSHAVAYLLQGKNIAWFQDRMEFGTRALGSRSILGNPLLVKTQSDLNLKIKQRESFRPFAPILLESEFEHYFGQDYSSPYMLFAHKLKPEFRKEFELTTDLFSSINQARSPFPAVTHVDYSSRIQTVNRGINPDIFEILVQFKERTGLGILVNTSFNIKDEPIVCTPNDAVECFLKTEIDILIMDNIIINKLEQ